MGHKPKFCKNCGEKLDPNVEIRNCTKCGTEVKAIVVKSLPYKSPGTAALLALIGGIFALPGIGHMYTRKVGMGAGILIGGFILYSLSLTVIISITSIRAYEAQYSPTGNASPVPIDLMVIILILVIGYITLFIWQIFNARSVTNRFNRLVKITGKKPW